MGKNFFSSNCWVKWSNPVWPEYWSLDELEKVKASCPLEIGRHNTCKNPTSEEGAILKREWWQPWTTGLPSLKHVIQSYDTAFSAKETADYSAITTWGVFQQNESEQNSIMLLDAVRGKLEFPELKALALEQYKYWEPETVVIEAKAPGQPLIITRI